MLFTTTNNNRCIFFLNENHKFTSLGTAGGKKQENMARDVGRKFVLMSNWNRNTTYKDTKKHAAILQES